MPQVDTFDAAFDAPATAKARAAQVSGLGRAIRYAWAGLLELLGTERTVEVTQAADEPQVMGDGLDIFADYYDGAHERVSAAEPVVSLRKLAP